jgi:hypothetical protein
MSETKPKPTRAKKNPPPTIEGVSERIELVELTAEMKAKIEAWDAIAPELAQIQGLAEMGWLQCAAGERTLPALLREITLLRSEHMLPPVSQDTGNIILSSFNMFCETLRSNLHRTDLTVQQHRYNAYSIAILNGILPSMRNIINLDGMRQAQRIVEIQIQLCDQALAHLSSPAGTYPAANSNANFEMMRMQNMSRTETEKTVLQNIASMLAAIVDGSTTPEKAFEVSAQARAAAAGIPPAATVN